MMNMVVGLGNPGEKYKNNRHNAGFIILDAFAESKGLSWTKNKKILSEVIVSKDDGFILVKPQTFMNDSGNAVSWAIRYFSIPSSDMIVIHDEVDLEALAMRVSVDSSSAGHHGVQDIIDKIGTQDFTRIRVGVGRPSENSRSVEKYVLEDFSSDELETVKKLGVEHLLSSLKV